MKALLYVILGLSLGAGCTLIALQERFLRERRRLLALGDSQRAKADMAVDEMKAKWEAECELLQSELQACQGRLAEAILAAEAAKEAVEESEVPVVATAGADLVLRGEHERLIQEKNTELSRLAAENKSLAVHLQGQQEELTDLHGQIAYLKEELAKAQEAVATQVLSDDDFVLLAAKGSGHLLPGAVARAFLKGNPNFPG